MKIESASFNNPGDRLPHPVCSDLEPRYLELFDYYIVNMDQAGILSHKGEVLAQLAYARVHNLDLFIPQRPSSFESIVLIKYPENGTDQHKIAGYRNALYWDRGTNKVFAGSFKNELNLIRRVKRENELEFASTLNSIIGTVNESQLKSYL